MMSIACMFSYRSTFKYCKTHKDLNIPYGRSHSKTIVLKQMVANIKNNVVSWARMKGDFLSNETHLPSPSPPPQNANVY